MNGWTVTISVVLLCLTAAAIVHDALRPPVRCVRPVTVTEITELNYRTATIRVSTGETVVVGQATLKVGGPWCLEWGR